MTFRTLIRRSLRFHWRSHLGVVLGAAVGSAALIGALIVGDSVRESLRERALERLGRIHFALDAGDRLPEADLPQRLQNVVISPASRAAVMWSGTPPTAGQFSSRTTGVVVMVTTNNIGFKTTNLLAVPVFTSPVTPFLNSTSTFLRVAGVLRAQGTAANADGNARANQVNVLGINLRLAELAGTRPPMPDEVVLNESLATQLKARVGETVLLRVRKPEAISAESPVSATDSSVALRMRVKAIVPDDGLGNLSLRANQVPPFNAFVALSPLQTALGTDGRINMVLAGGFEEVVTRNRLNWLQQFGRKLNAQWKWTQPRLAIYTNITSDDIGLVRLENGVRQSLGLGDLQIHFRWLRQYGGLEARSPRIFIEPALGDLLATNGANYVTQRPVRILTYLVNQFRAGELTTPYSMVTATDSPLLPADLRDDEIVINQWLADDLNARQGSEIALTYFAPDQAAQLIERTNVFRVRAVVPMTNVLCDRTFMPDFPGIAKAEHAGDWETSFPLVHKIRPKDDAYWQEYRGTPKAFVSLRAGQKMWANRFGNLTAVRWEFARQPSDDSTAFWQLRNAEAALKAAFSDAVKASVRGTVSAENPGRMVNLPGISVNTRSSIEPAAFSLAFQPVRQQALQAAAQSQDFGGLFIGFSFFLIGAALILMGLLFRFGTEQRVMEIGTLLALGFRPRQVRRIFLLEGAALALVGSVIGAVGGIFYARAMLHGLTTLWRSATNTSALSFHASPATLLTGIISGTIVAVITIWLVLRKQARQPARELLAGDLECGDLSPPFGSATRSQSDSVTSRGMKKLRRVAALRRWLCAPVVAWVCLGLAVATVAVAYATGETSNPEYFFSAGSFALIAGLAFTSWTLHRMVGHAVLSAPDESTPQPGGALRTPRPTASVSSSILSIRGAARRKSRSVATVALLACGVFLIASIGVFRLDADANAWKRSSGTGGFALIGETTVPIVKDLNTPGGRETLGLDEKILKDVRFIPFRVREGDDASCLNLNRAQQPRLLGVRPGLLAERKAFSFANKTSWDVLNPDSTAQTEARAIGDAASIQWALHKKIGDTLPYRDERGNDFNVRLVGALANSILQGSLIIDEAEFIQRFPSVSGYRMFLIDCPSNALPEVSAELTRALQDYGFEVTPAAQRLAAFNAVQNTYLNTFQVLGGLGLLLGSLGLGIVVLRNVLERRAELALLIAVGFRRARVQRLVLTEHAALLGLGLMIGVAAALVAVLPSLLSPRGELPVVSLSITLAGVLLFGLISTWLATRVAVRGNLLEGLRNE